MPFIDVSGVLYSGARFRFGGFQTQDFLHVTLPLENARPGVREEIIGEAHYLADWIHRFAEIAFLIGLAGYESILVGFMFLVAGYVIELARFYLFGAWPLASQLCRLWYWVRFPVCALLALILWRTSYTLAIVVIIFAVIQVWLGAITAGFLAPLRLLILGMFRRGLQRLHPKAYVMEAMAVKFVIDRWSRKLNVEPNSSP